MSFTRTLLAAALFTAVVAGPAHAWTTESLTITGGSMTMYNASDTFGTVLVLPGPSSTLDDGIVNGAVDADGLHGGPANPVTPSSSSASRGTPSSPQHADALDLRPRLHARCRRPRARRRHGQRHRLGPGHQRGSFRLFFTEWNGNYIRQGGHATGTGEWIVVPTPEAGTGVYNFSLQWSAHHDAGPFQGFTSDWVLTGTAVAVVPEPETYALMVAGLGLVAGAARRCRATAAHHA